MKTSKLIALVAAAALLAVLALWSGKARTPRKPEQIGKPVLPGLQINDIRRIELSQQGKAVALASTDAGWVVASHYNYPADIGKIRENLLALRDLKIGDVQRGITLDAATVTLVDLQDERGKSLASLRLGDVRTKPNEQYGWDMPYGRSVAANTDDTAFLVKDTLNAFEPDAKTWISTELLSVQAADVASISLAGPDGVFTLDRASGLLTLADLTDDETFDSSKAYGVESALSQFRFIELADPTLSDAETGMATGHTYTVTCTDGTIYTARIGATAPDRSERYLRLAVSAEPVSTNAAERSAITQKAAVLNATVSPWLYLVASWSTDNMTRSRADFIQAPAAETPEIENPGIEQPETENPEVEQPEVEEPEVEQPVTELPEPDAPPPEEGDPV